MKSSLRKFVLGFHEIMESNPLMVVKVGDFNTSFVAQKKKKNVGFLEDFSIFNVTYVRSLDHS